MTSTQSSTENVRDSSGIDYSYRDADLLRRLYYDEGLNQSEIADRANCARRTVSKWMKELDVSPGRGRSREDGPQSDDVENGRLTGNLPWRDPETLQELYHNQELSLRDIAAKLGCSDYTIYKHMVEHGIETREHRVGYANFYTATDGHEYWNCRYGYEQDEVAVHRLLMVAAGADPTDVFGGGFHVHHTNHIPWDNRSENLELVEPDEHLRLHRDHFQQPENAPWLVRDSREGVSE